MTTHGHNGKGNRSGGARRRVGAALGLALGLAAAGKAEPAAAPAVWRFAVIGETRGDGTNTPADPWVNTPVVNALAQAIAREDVAFVMAVGNLVYGQPPSDPGGPGTNLAVQFAQWKAALAPVYEAGIPVYPVRGERDARGDTPQGTAFRAALGAAVPRNGPTGEVGLTYGFAHRNAVILGLDQSVRPHRVNQDWLDANLPAGGWPHLFVFGAEPAVQVETPDCLARERAARNAFLDGLARWEGHYYVCGGDRFYNRARLWTAGGGAALEQVVVGTGGAPAGEWAGAYGRDYGEGGMAARERHVGGMPGYLLVTVSNFAVTLAWKASTNLADWTTHDAGQHAARNPATSQINDFDGDGKTDPAVYNPAAASWTILLSGQGDAPWIFSLGGPGWRAAPGDYDGDGQTDPAVMNKAGAWTMLLSGSGHQAVVTNFGAAGALPISGDYDGDGVGDAAAYRMLDGRWDVQFSGGGAATAALGGPGWVPVPADYDADSRTDPAVYREAGGEWMAALSSRNYELGVAVWGGPGWVPVPADYDGDGRTDLCAYYRTTGDWQALLSGSGYTTAAVVVLGGGTDRAVPGDYDGDRRADPVVYDGGAPEWRMRLSGSLYQDTNLVFGGTAWLAVGPTWKADLVMLAFGDSITYGGGSRSDGPATAYAARLETRLQRRYDGYFKAINSGIPGEETYEGVWRLARVLNTVDADLLLLMEGTNDHGNGTPYATIEANLRRMIEMALGRGLGVVLATIPPVISTDVRDRSGQQARIIGFNPRIYRIAADYHIPVARVYESITSVPGWQYLLMEPISANHPNDAGHQRVCDAFYAPVSAGLESGEFF